MKAVRALAKEDFAVICSIRNHAFSFGLLAYGIGPFVRMKDRTWLYYSYTHEGSWLSTRIRTHEGSEDWDVYA